MSSLVDFDGGYARNSLEIIILMGKGIIPSLNIFHLKDFKYICLIFFTIFPYKMLFPENY